MKWDDSPKGKLYRKEYHKKYYQDNKEKYRAMQLVYYSDPVKRKQKNKKDRERNMFYKAKMYYILGGPKCVYCGYDEDPRALQLDHINGGGRADRRRHHSYAAKYWMEFKDNPEGLKTKFQVLCANCNVIKKFKNNE